MGWVVVGTKGISSSPRMPIGIRPPTQTIFSWRGRTADIYPSLWKRICLGPRLCRSSFALLSPSSRALALIWPALSPGWPLYLFGTPWSPRVDIFSIHHTMKTTKLLGYKTLRYTNTIASWIERWTKAYVSGSKYAFEKIFNELHPLWWPLKQSLHIFRVVRKESPNIYSRIGQKSNLKN